jgi:hypothetical protein
MNVHTLDLYWFYKTIHIICIKTPLFKLVLSADKPYMALFVNAHRLVWTRTCINKRLFTMKVENHDTTKQGTQHENLLKREMQRMWTNIKLCLTTSVHVYYSFLILQLLYVCYAYLLITKLLKILIFAHGEHKKKFIKMYWILFYIHIHSF